MNTFTRRFQILAVPDEFEKWREAAARELMTVGAWLRRAAMRELMVDAQSSTGIMGAIVSRGSTNFRRRSASMADVHRSTLAAAVSSGAACRYCNDTGADMRTLLACHACDVAERKAAAAGRAKRRRRMKQQPLPLKKTKKKGARK